LRKRRGGKNREGKGWGLGIKLFIFIFFGIAFLCLEKKYSGIGKPVGQNKAFYP
jgi:hypothetical protein